MTKGRYAIRLLTTTSFFVMIYVNWFASKHMIHGVTTAEVSANHPTMFTPIGSTFAIWGVIYLWLFLYVAYQSALFGQETEAHAERMEKVDISFCMTSFANTAWIFLWHYGKIGSASLVLVISLLYLYDIQRLLSSSTLTKVEYWMVRVPFSVYFGWITVATVANANILILSSGFSRFGLTEEGWTVLLITGCLLIGLLLMLKQREGAYGAVLIWAFWGIYRKNLDLLNADEAHSQLPVALLLAIALLVAAEGYLLYHWKKSKIVTPPLKQPVCLRYNNRSRIHPLKNTGEPHYHV